ncbi:MAG: hypothetical protein ABWX96_07170, partial [Propionibacteriaceae bacterium]
MTDAGRGLEPTQRFELRAPLVVGALLLGAALAVVGAVLAVVWRAYGWNLVVLLLGLLLILAAVVLVVVALAAYRRGRQIVLIQHGDIAVRGREGERRVALREVTEVRVSDLALRLLLAGGSGEPLVVANPGGRGQAGFEAMMRAV